MTARSSARIQRPAWKVLAAVMILAGQAHFAGLSAKKEETPPVWGPGKVVVIPFVLDGRVDKPLTDAFQEEIAARETGWSMVEAASVAQKLRKGEKLASNAPVESLLRAAKAAGAEAVILGRATRYKVLDAPGVRLRLTMHDVKAGTELHSGFSEESGWTSDRAKRDAAKTATKQLLKDLGID